MIVLFAPSQQRGEGSWATGMEKAKLPVASRVCAPDWVSASSALTRVAGPAPSRAEINHQSNAELSCTDCEAYPMISSLLPSGAQMGLRALVNCVPTRRGGAAVYLSSLFADDFAFGADGTLFVATQLGEVIRVAPDGTRTSFPTGKFGDAAVSFGRTAQDRQGIYVVNNGGVFLGLPGGPRGGDYHAPGRRNRRSGTRGSGDSRTVLPLPHGRRMRLLLIVARKH